VHLVRVFELFQRHANVLSELGTRFVVFHHPTAGVVFAVPNDLGGGSLVEHQAEWAFVLPHLASYVIATAQLVGEPVAVSVKDKTTDSSQSLGGQELDLGIRILGIHQTGGMNLHPLQINRAGANRDTKLDAVTGAVLPVGGREVHQVRTVLSQQRILGEVSPKASRGKDDAAKLLEGLATARVLAANDRALIVLDELCDLRFGDNAGNVRVSLRHLLNHLNQSIRDGHARESLLTTVRARRGVATQPREQGQVQIEHITEPVHIGTTVVGQHLNQLGFLGPTLQAIRGKEFDRVLNSLRPLGAGVGTVNATRRLG